MKSHVLALSLAVPFTFAAASSVATGCSSSAPTSTYDTDGGGGGGTGGGSTSGATSGGATNGGASGGSLGDVDASSGNNDGCSDAAKLIYVLSDANDLYSFNPPSKKFIKIGALGCKVSGGLAPNSMAIDRNATAWVNYTSANAVTGADTAGAIYKVSTTDASCTGPSITLKNGWFRLGMGYSTNSATSTDETLFVAATPSGGLGAGGGTEGLGKVDFTGKTVTAIGQFDGSLAGQSAELTGTGDGRLFGFFTAKPVHVAEINKTTGGIVGTPPAVAGVEQPAAWAFSFWGGAFYLYTSPDPLMNPSRTTNVTKYTPGGTVPPDTGYMTNIGFRIVGAGVSTCAPLDAPK